MLEACTYFFLLPLSGKRSSSEQVRREGTGTGIGVLKEENIEGESDKKSQSEWEGQQR